MFEKHGGTLAPGGYIGCFVEGSSPPGRLMKTIALLLVLFASASNAAAQSALKVLTLNTNHGGQAPWSVANQVAAIVAQAPDVVFLQEAAVSQLDEYVSGINAGLSTTAWHGAAARH